MPCKSRCHQTPIYMFCIFMPSVSRCSINARIEPSSSITWLLKILVFKTCLGSYFLYLLNRSQFQNDFTFITCFSSNGCKTNHPKILWCGTITYPIYMFCKFMQNLLSDSMGQQFRQGTTRWFVCSMVSQTSAERLDPEMWRLFIHLSIVADAGRQLGVSIVLYVGLFMLAL